MSDFLLAFFPLCVAIDAPFVVPVFLSITEGLPAPRKRKIVDQAVSVALVLAVGFAVLGSALFSLIGITLNDFRIGGGLVLIVTAILFLVGASETKAEPSDDIGIVPLAVPLIVGPSALTTLMIAVKSYGYPIALTSLGVNLGIVWFLLHRSQLLTQLVGTSAIKAAAKISALLLAGIAVAMIRTGLHESITAH